MSFLTSSSLAFDARCGLHHRAVVAGAVGHFLRLPLADLLLEIDEVGLPIEGVAQLILAIEFDQHVAGPDGRAGMNQAHDDERVVVLPRETRRRNRGRLDGLDGAAQPDAAHEVLPS